MAMLKARPSRRQEGLDEFGFAKLAEEAESISTNILVRVLKIITDSVAVGN
jgi:hypothetical protein